MRLVRKRRSNKIGQYGAWTNLDKNAGTIVIHTLNLLNKINWFDSVLAKSLNDFDCFIRIRFGIGIAIHRYCRSKHLLVAQSRHQWVFRIFHCWCVERLRHWNQSSLYVLRLRMRDEPLEFIRLTGDHDLFRRIDICNRNFGERLNQIADSRNRSSNCGHGSRRTLRQQASSFVRNIQ